MRTGLKNYGLDKFSFGSVTVSTATHFQSAASTSWHKWIRFEPAFRVPPLINGIPSEDTMRELETSKKTFCPSLNTIQYMYIKW